MQPQHGQLHHMKWNAAITWQMQPQQRRLNGDTQQLNDSSKQRAAQQQQSTLTRQPAVQQQQSTTSSSVTTANDLRLGVNSPRQAAQRHCHNQTVTRGSAATTKQQAAQQHPVSRHQCSQQLRWSSQDVSTTSMLGVVYNRQHGPVLLGKRNLRPGAARLLSYLQQ